MARSLIIQNSTVASAALNIAHAAWLLDKTHNGLPEQRFYECILAYSRSFICRHSGMTADARDLPYLSSDLAWEIFRSAGNHRSKVKFSTYCHPIGKRTLAKWWETGSRTVRHAKCQSLTPNWYEDRHKELEPSEFEKAYGPDGDGAAFTWAPLPERELTDDNAAAFVEGLLAELPVVDRAICVGKMKGYTDRELAGRLKLTVSAVKSRFNKLKLRLRNKYSWGSNFSCPERTYIVEIRERPDNPLGSPNEMAGGELSPLPAGSSSKKLILSTFSQGQSLASAPPLTLSQ